MAERMNREEAFFAMLREGASVRRACAAAGMARSTAYRRRADDPDFARAWDDAVEDGTDHLEDEMVRRAVEGIDKPVFYKGEPVGHVRVYSDTLLMFTLRARRPDKFKDRVAAEHSGKDGAPLTVNILRFGGDGED